MHGSSLEGSQGTELPHAQESNGAGTRFRLLKKIRAKLMNIFFPPSNSLEEEVVEFIEERDPEGTQLSSEERTMVHNILGLGDIKVDDVMIPRTDVVAIEDTASLEALKALIVSKEHTRIPVYKESLDNVIGFVHIKDLIPLLGTNKPFNMESVVHEILYVPPSMKILDLLVKMRDCRIHMALVLDEYGGTDGLVTMEDLMEEIVGEIEDEHDEVEKSEIITIDDNTFEVSARTAVEELEEKLHMPLRPQESDEDFDTVGGLIFSMLGRVPDQGEIIPHPQGLEFKIIEADPRRIKKLLIRKP